MDVLARTLKATRGSFHWHFRDREDLLRTVLQGWRARATEQLSSLGFGIAEAPIAGLPALQRPDAESLLATQGSAAQRQERAALVERLLKCP